ncbi:MAG: DUF4070 domain-containing protein [Desulfomonilia bacterium]
MKALFIYPEIPETFWSFKYALEYVSKKSAFPPLGLLTIAAMVPDTWHKRLVDMNVGPLMDADLLWADYAFISVMSVQKASFSQILARCRELGVKVVAGGPHFTSEEGIIEGVEHLVLGEAEETFRNFLEDLRRGQAKGIYIPQSNPDLSLTCEPEWSLIDFRDYDSMLLQFSRGCPFDCEFCDIVRINGRKQRTKSASRFIAEVEGLFLRGWRGSVFIVDDNFIGVKSKAKEMLKALAGWMDAHGRPFHFFTEASVNLAEDAELMDLMANAGFNKVFIGIESPNAQSLSEAGKMQNLKTDLLKSVRVIQSHGLEVMGGFIIGFDSDPEDIFEKQIEFIQGSGIIMAMVGLLEALKGTRLWKRLNSEGRLLSESSGDNTDCKLNFIPKMDRETLISGYRRVLETIYAPAAYYWRCREFLGQYHQRTVSIINSSGIKAFFKSLWRIGVCNEEGFRPYYWKLLIRSLLTCPKTFGEVVRLMIVGIHFRKCLLKNRDVTLFPDLDPFGKAGMAQKKAA